MCELREENSPIAGASQKKDRIYKQAQNNCEKNLRIYKIDIFIYIPYRIITQSSQTIGKMS